MKTLNILVISLASLALVGCKSLYGKYERPDLKVSKGLVRDAVLDRDSLIVNDTTSFGNLAWKSVFTDAKLQNLIETGVANNTDLLNAALNVKTAEAQLLASKLAFLPSLTFSPQGTISSWDNMAATKTYSLPVAASWNIDLFGTLLSSKRSSQMALLGYKDYQQVVKTRLISNIANTYYTLLMLDKQVELVKGMEQLAKDTWEIMKVRKELNAVRSTNVSSAEASYYSVQAQRVALERQVRETENSLSLLLGQQAGYIERGTFDNQSLPEKFSTGVAINMLNNRPDVHYAEMSLAQCFHNVQTARSRFYPSLTISGTGAFTNNSGAGIVNPGKMLLNAVGSLTQPLFQRGQIIAGLKVAKYQYEQAFNTWQYAVLNAGSEVSNALVLYNASAEKSRVEALQVAALKRLVEDTQLLMQQSSNVTYLEVITAQQNLLNAELTKVQDDFSKMQAVVNLYYALGGGR